MSTREARISGLCALAKEIDATVISNEAMQAIEQRGRHMLDFSLAVKREVRRMIREQGLRP